MEKYESVNCAICDSDNLEKITEKGQFGFPTHVCICKDCGLSFLNPRWDEASYQDFYANRYDKYYRSHKRTKPLEEDPYSYYPILMRMKSSLNDQKQFGNVLDIGSGDGTLLTTLIKHQTGKAYYAIEPSASHKEQLLEKNIHFISNDVNSDWHARYENHFDLIIMRHVLEHFLNPAEVLEKLKSVLTDDGIIYIAVPDSFNPTPPFTDFFFRTVHTYYFNRVSLTNLLHKTGFRVLSIKEGDSYHGEELFLFAEKSDQPLKVEIDSANYKTQREIFVKGVRAEERLNYQIKSGIKKAKEKIVQAKKRIFPNPVFKK